MASPGYNLRNPAVKRIMQECKEMEREQGTDFIAQALEDNIFEWHFVLRGPQGTDFEGGIFHGRILLPPEYPMKPPAFMMLTPNGRFQTSTKICLSISSYHPEHWQPSWSVRTALTALTAFMPSPGNGAIGSLDCPAAERKKMAEESRSFVPPFGNEDRQALSAEMHETMLEIDAKVREQAKTEEQEQDAEKEKEEVAEADGGSSFEPLSQEQQGPVAEQPTPSPEVFTEPPADPSPVVQQQMAPPMPQTPEQQLPHEVGQVDQAPTPEADIVRPREAVVQHPPELCVEEKGLTYLAGALSVAIAALLLRKFLVFFDLSIGDQM